ncbi:glycosyltransferase family 4 protein [Globicatella sp. PHS-GS-PNBC-21-1553]|uniref:glycosyltransferase family 4 protein n=1 Tax=Globicatella sp. PHS-GS-PNBC-21-1553 TaxID=2885764 RepID=UPI00298EE08A|nr:glycosyltransferase family 4 protein [Globicatella sp. PHS-GS-PNBC-21-1553]WPC09063.1 glycosyltransferase family 4 protein [Globicatella sp. PHS-GS-PNBC-21-1553]
MKRVLYVVTILPTAKAFLLPHMNMLKEKGYKVDLAGNSNSIPISNEINKVVDNVYDVKFSRKPISRTNLISLFQMRKIIKENNYDIVHVHTPVASFFTRLATVFLNCRVYYTAHGFHFFKGSPIKNWMTYFVAEYLLSYVTDITFTMNREDYKVATKYFQNRNNKVYNTNGVGVNLSKFVPISNELKKKKRNDMFNENKLNVKLDDIIFTYVGELSNRKNQMYLLESLKDGIPNNIKFFLIGDGKNKNELSNKINDYGLNNNVFLLGRKENIPDWFGISDFGFSISKQEGLPVNIMEAMAVGLPILASNVRGNNDLVQDRINGYLFDLNSQANYLTQLISDIINDENLLEYSQKSIELIEKYKIDNILLELEKYY